MSIKYNSQFKVFSLFLIFLLFSCKQKEKPLSLNEFKNKTFVFYGSPETDPFYIDFKDSTYSNFIYEEPPNKWKVAHYEGNDFLIFNEVVYGIKRSEKGFTIQNIAQNKRNFKIKEERPKWKKSQIIGEWIDEKADSSFMSIPLTSEGLEMNEEIWPPLFIIKEDTIYHQSLTDRSKSEYEISNSNNFIELKLDTEPFLSYHTLWKIEKLTDSSMTIKSKVSNEMHFNQNESRTLLLKKVIKTTAKK